MGELIAVLSGKGGTGKTSVCAAVASALAESKEKVLCIDCDIGLRNLDIALGLQSTAELSFLEVCRGNVALSDAPAHPQYPSMQFLTAPMHCQASAVAAKEFESLLQQARQQFDYVLIDAPAGIEAGFSLAARYADRILLVTAADPASIRDARRAADVLELMGKTNIRLIVNRINKKMITAMRMTVDDIMDQAGLGLLGVIPDDANVTLAAAFEKPLLCYTCKGAAAACKRIARRIMGLHVPITL